jgi:16S rRNA (uracil1498-N3)-methyltransferase
MAKTIHRFFVTPSAIHEDGVVVSDREQVHQMSRVLRMEAGDSLIVLNGKGTEYLVKIMSVSKEQILCRHVDQWPAKGEPSLSIRLFQAIPKSPSKFEEVLRHGTEIGVSEFYPLLTHHGEVSELRKRERMETILRESAEQSERGRIPVLGPEISLKDVLNTSWPVGLEAGTTLMAHSAREPLPLLAELLQKNTLQEASTLNLLIGPEGGFSDAEALRAEEKGFLVFSLGPRILRTETAGIAVVSAILLGHATGRSTVSIPR